MTSTNNNDDAMKFTYANSAYGIIMDITWNASTSFARIDIKDMEGKVLDSSIGTIDNLADRNFLNLDSVVMMNDELMADGRKAYYCIESMLDWMTKMNIAAIHADGVTVQYATIPEGIKVSLIKDDLSQKALVIGRDGSLNLLDSEGNKTPMTYAGGAIQPEVQKGTDPLTIDALIKRINTKIALVLSGPDIIPQRDHNEKLISRLTKLSRVLQKHNADQLDLDVFAKAVTDLGA